jgi:hypothetical protein
MRPRNKPGSRAPQTSDEIYTCTKSYGAKFEILIKLFLENVEIFHNCLELPFFGLKIRLLFTDLFRILFRIQFWIRIRSKVSDPYGPGSGSATLLLSLPEARYCALLICTVIFVLGPVLGPVLQDPG